MGDRRRKNRIEGKCDGLLKEEERKERIKHLTEDVRDGREE